MEEDIERSTFPGIARKLIHRFYLQPYRNASRKLFKKENNLRDGNLERNSHGAMHATRASVWALVYLILYTDLGNEDAKCLTGRELALLQIAALMHDSARGDDGHDWWDEQSAQFCKRVLFELGCSEKEAETFSRAISNKDSKNQKNICEKTVHDADCSEIVRVKSFLPTHVYDLKFLDVYNDNSSSSESVNLICSIAELIRQVIRAQSDQKWPNYIQLNGRGRYGFSQGTLNTTKKLKFEQSKNCYWAVCETLKEKRFSLLKNYFDRGTAAVDVSSFNIKGLLTKPYVQQLAEQLNEKLFGDKDIEIHEMKINRGGDFCFTVFDAPPIKKGQFIQRLHGSVFEVEKNNHKRTQLIIQAEYVARFFHLLEIPLKLGLVMYENILRCQLEPEGCLFVSQAKVYVYGPKHSKEQWLSLSETKKALKERASSFWGGFFGWSEECKPEKIADSLLSLLNWLPHSFGPVLPGYLWEIIMSYLSSDDCKTLSEVGIFFGEYDRMKNMLDL